MREYKNQFELYEGLIPALNVKVKMLKKNDYQDITKEDIWDYLKNYYWKNSVDLTLGDMVQDIIHTDNLELVRYVEKKKGNMEGNE